MNGGFPTVSPPPAQAILAIRSSPFTSIPMKLQRKKKIRQSDGLRPFPWRTAFLKLPNDPCFCRYATEKRISCPDKIPSVPLPRIFLANDILRQKKFTMTATNLATFTPKNDKWKCRFSRWYISIRSPSGPAEPIFASLQWLVTTGLDKINRLSIGFGFRSFWKGPQKKIYLPFVTWKSTA